MKKLIILIAALSVLVSTATAQITQVQADEIVLERLETVTQEHQVFCKNEAQEFTIITANDETLELNYLCWVYYVNYTDDIIGWYIVVNESNGNVLEVKPTSNAVPEDIAEWRDVNNETDCTIEAPSIWQYSNDTVIIKLTFYPENIVNIKSIPEELGTPYLLRGNTTTEYRIENGKMYLKNPDEDIFDEQFFWNITCLSENEIVLHYGGFSVGLLYITTYHFTRQTN